MLRRIAQLPRFLLPVIAVLALTGERVRAAGTASNITGVYYTGLSSNGSLASGGTNDANWMVTYASTNGGASTDSTYQGSAYVVDPSNVAGSGYTPNTSGAQWITAPGSYENASTVSGRNSGGDFLPGNGNAGSNEGIYIYTLAFNIAGTGGNGSVVTNQIQMTMTLAADDQYSVFVNPAGNGTTNPTGTASASETSAWSNKSQITLQNFGTGSLDNATFKIGTNYIVVVVDNTNSVIGASAATDLNASGLLVYQTTASTIDGRPVPEVATWLPLLGVIGCYGWVLRRRRQGQPQPACA